MRYLKFVVYSAIILFIMVFVTTGSFITFIDYKIFDMLSQDAKNPSKSVVIVAIDEKSLETLGQWPWNRIITAKIAQNILLAKPAVLGIDVILAERDRTSLKEVANFYKNRMGLTIDIDSVPDILQDNDEILSSALSASKSVMGLFMNDGKNECEKFSAIKSSGDINDLAKFSGMLCSYKTINNKASGNGFINSKISIDGNLRQNVSFVSYKDSIVPSLTMAMLMQVDPNMTLKSSKFDTLELEFLGQKRYFSKQGTTLNTPYNPKNFKVVSAIDILNPDFDKSILTGKFVILGATATGLYDHYISTDGALYPGVFHHASFLENFIENSLIINPLFFKNFFIFLVLIFSMLLAFIYHKKGYTYVVGFFVVVSILATFIAYIFMKKGIYISVGYFLVTFVVPMAFVSLFGAYRGFLERKAHILDMESANRSTIASMIAVVDGKDGETGGHIIRTRNYIEVLCKYLQKKGLYKDIITNEFIEILYRAVPLHDIGKVAIPDYILKKEVKLDEEEMAIMKTHVEKGKEIIEKSISMSETKNKFLIYARNIVYTHHEKWDGSGYPQGLKGEEIPLEGRLMAIVDVYDALVCERYYKKSYSFEKSEDIIISQSGKHFDPVLVEAFKEIKDEFRNIALKIS